MGLNEKCTKLVTEVTRRASLSLATSTFSNQMRSLLAYGPNKTSSSVRSFREIQAEIL